MLGAVVGWLLGAAYYLEQFVPAPPWRFWPKSSYIDLLSLLIATGAATAAALYAARKNRELWTRILVGAIIGAVLGIKLCPQCSYYWTTQVRVLAVNPLFEFRMSSWAVFGSQLGAVIAIAIRGLGTPQRKFQFSLCAMMLGMAEVAAFCALLTTSRMPTH